MNWPKHGSNPQYIYKETGIPKPEKWIDFSANINPLGSPQILKEKWLDFYQKINDYPDPHTQVLKKLISNKTAVDPESILLGNGGAELIALLGRILAGGNVLLIEPAFSEYESACSANDCQIFYHQLDEPAWELNVEEITSKLSAIDAVFLCTPNNPTGIGYSNETIVKLLEECKKTDTLLILDEAFYDFLEDYTPISPLIKEYSNLVIIRSMTKMFAIPGLRLGYILANPRVIDKLSGYQPHWSVNALAMSAGELFLQDTYFVQNIVNYIRSEREKLFSFFLAEGFEFSPSQVNFYLLRDPLEKEQMPLFTFLLRRGIVPRHTFNFPGLEGKWLRFAIKSTEENNYLMEVFEEWRQLP
ncbi:threonine-phosphate decarboxylase [Virgibacillus indicus]|uniref:threonine-phosphate decarboxylase n=1 Tax=Virgibacillus indicus TaxID=2024554 RepID=A0A265N7L1_9BACI|nr:threonine-phosphate decarboxylase CobD [Virgibacillus indicus]OZU87326.1 threonine-phosphate decarboxylase [Virgibacillus indicus]